MKELTLDHVLLGLSVVFFVGCLIYAIRHGKTASITLLPSAIRAKHPLRAAFDAIEEQAHEEAAKQLAAMIGAHYASEHQTRIQAAFGPKADISPPASAPTRAPPASSS